MPRRGRARHRDPGEPTMCVATIGFGRRQACRYSLRDGGFDRLVYPFHRSRTGSI